MPVLLCAIGLMSSSLRGGYERCTGPPGRTCMLSCHGGGVAVSRWGWAGRPTPCYGRRLAAAVCEGASSLPCPVVGEGGGPRGSVVTFGVVFESGDGRSLCR